MTSIPPETPGLDQPRYRPVPLDEFVATDVPRTRWAVKDIWPEGAKGIIAGPPKSCKSTLSEELAISLATQTPLFNLPQFPVEVPAARVTWIHQGENSLKRIRKDFDEILTARGLGEMEEIYANYTVNAEREHDGLEPLAEGGDEDVVLGHRFTPTWNTDWDPDLQVLVNPGFSFATPEDREWFIGHAATRDYIFLDPIYMLAPVSSQDETSWTGLLNFLSEVRDSTECALIFTHQLTNKSYEGREESRMLGTTHLEGWMETGVFASRADDDTVVSFRFNNVREMGETSDVVLAGEGVGHWRYVEEAQDQRDVDGRRAPRKAAKEVRKAQLRELLDAHPDWTDEKLAAELGRGVKTVRTYKKELEDDGWQRQALGSLTGGNSSNGS